MIQQALTLGNADTNMNNCCRKSCHRCLFFCFILLLSGQIYSQESRYPHAEEGTLDLSDWDFVRDGSIHISGEFEFYWNQLLSPDYFASDSIPQMDGFISVPASWNTFQFQGRAIGGSGHATYRLRIILGKHGQALGLKFLNMGTAFAGYLNGKKIASAGTVGRDKEESDPQYLSQVTPFSCETGELEIIFHVSNYHHARGGVWEPIQLGIATELQATKNHREILDYILFGCFLIIGLYHIGIFILTQRYEPPLYFGLFCVLIAFRAVATGERALFEFLENADWGWLVTLEYFTAYAAVPVFGVYLYHLFEDDFNKTFLKLMVVTGIGLSAIVFFTPVAVFTHTLHVYHGFSYVCLAYGLYLLLQCVRKQRESSLLVLGAFIILGAATINDVLYADEVIQTNHWVPISIFIFVVLQAYLLAARFSRAFMTIEHQHEQLKQANEQYILELKERKRAEEEKQELEAQLLRVEKMKTVGLLSSGIAHDLNNILSGIVGYPDLLLLDMKDDNPFKGPILAIKESGIRAAAIIQDLLILGRRAVVSKTVTNINDIVSTHLDSLEHKNMLLRYADIKVACDLEPDLLNLKGSTIHIQKSVMNLILNAAESQPQGGVIQIRSENRYVDKPIQGYDQVKEGDYVVLSVTDNGPGISQGDRQKIFEPFYTKKAMGRSGTGLGMSIVWGTVQDHQGYIDIVPAEGCGTSFVLYFPASREKLQDNPATVPLNQYSAKGCENVLVVDDIPEQCILAANILTKLGYKVHTAGSGEEAIRYMENQSCDILVLDMIMDPGIDGFDTYKNILQRCPGTKAIIASGYAETERVRMAQELGAGAYVRKPYTIENLGVAIRTELDK